MREDHGTRTEQDAAAWSHAHRPDADHPTASDIADQPADGTHTAYDLGADELLQRVVELQRRIVARDIGWHEDGAA